MWGALLGLGLRVGWFSPALCASLRAAICCSAAWVCSWRRWACPACRPRALSKTLTALSFSFISSICAQTGERQTLRQVRGDGVSQLRPSVFSLFSQVRHRQVRRTGERQTARQIRGRKVSQLSLFYQRQVRGENWGLGYFKHTSESQVQKRLSSLCNLKWSRWFLYLNDSCIAHWVSELRVCPEKSAGAHAHKQARVRKFCDSAHDKLFWLMSQVTFAGC